MKTLGLLMLAAATTGTGGMADGFGKPHALNSLFRPHVVRHGPPPASGPIMAPPVDPGLGAAGFGGGRAFSNTTSQIFFVDPANMEITWQTAGSDGMPVYLPPQLTVPARYNFRQGFIYRLKLSNIPNYAGVSLYPTLEVAPGTPQTDAYLTHNPIPVQFTAEDFDQIIDGGNFVTKVVYLPDPKFQELAVAGLYGAETLVSTRLEPGVDPILEADKRGTILMIIRAGAIDLEMPADGGYAPATGGVIYGDPGATMPPPEAMTPPASPIDSVPLDQPPVSPAPPDAGQAPPIPSPAPEDVPTTSIAPIESAVSPASLPGPVGDGLPPLLP
ncbi:hypothetical protein [Tautonia plasticadhaerens]|uniref:Uncharacterized protein n=1 Tax=Tautonia plasticadhaerens TaxID=2527974 RepID=A0A518HAN4_9BACT|nr:hypothetical protein [Tautonia plasticadhaerens]QDV37910.1 hypothetical protein ElP_58570 [Tautonia plasticadhaerens]